MRAHTKARDVLLVFEEDVGAALTKDCEQDGDNDVVHLASAAQTVRRHMFEEGEPFNGFPEGCQEDYVPSLLLALVGMVLEGPSIKDQMAGTKDRFPSPDSVYRVIPSCVIWRIRDRFPNPDHHYTGYQVSRLD